MDQFATALEHRLRTYELISSRFGCLRKLDVLHSQEILLAEWNLFEVYKNDLDVNIGNELVQLADFVIPFKDEQAEDVSREHFM